MMKVAELKRVEQGKKMIEGFVQKFRRIARESRYEKRLLIKEFKREMNGTIMRKLMEAKYPFRSIEQRYKRVVNLDKHWRESKSEEERVRSKREMGF